MKEMVLENKKDNLEKILLEIENALSKYTLSLKSKFQLELVIEEIFVNIADYAYEDVGEIIIKYDVTENPLKFKMVFIDNGIKFNPIELNCPDISLNADERDIGGLGFLLIRKNIDNIKYKYENNQNILTIEKIF